MPFRNRPRHLALALAALAPLLGAACGGTPLTSQPAQSEQQLYEAAKREGSVVWLTAYYPQDATQALVNAFEARYPGVKVSFARQTAQIVYQRLIQEQQAQVPVTDVFSSTDAGQYLEQKRQGHLQPYRPQNITSLQPEFQHLDADDAYQLGAVAFVIMNYNPVKANGTPIPKRWTDLLDPRLKGRITTGNPAFSGYVGNWVVAMLDKYGQDYFRQLSANQPKVNRSINDTVDQVVTGDRTFGVSSENYSLEKKTAGSPIEVVYPEDDAVAIFSPVAIIKDAPHPNAARLFENFMYSREYSQALVKSFNFPLRSDVVSATGKTLHDLKWYHNDPARLTDGVPQAIEIWRSLFGA